MSVSSILSAIAPQFDSDPNRAVHIQLSMQRTSDCFGVNYEYAIALRAAHTLTLTKLSQSTGGVGGQVVGMREGDLSISYSSSQNSNNGGDLNKTTYGQQLQELIKGNIIVADIAGKLGGLW